MRTMCCEQVYCGKNCIIRGGGLETLDVLSSKALVAIVKEQKEKQ